MWAAEVACGTLSDNDTSKARTISIPRAISIWIKYIRLEAGGWRLEAGGWRLKAGGWRLEAGGWTTQIEIEIEIEIEKKRWTLAMAADPIHSLMC
jgi:hypothetical protein